MSILDKIRPYAKAAVAVAGVAATVANIVANGTDPVQVAIAVLVALGVYKVPNKDAV